MSLTDPSRPSGVSGPAVPVIEAVGLTKSFGDNQVLRGIDLTVGPGEVVALIGPSGSGKTTLLRCLNALEVPDGGSIVLGGEHPQAVTFPGAAGRSGAKAPRVPKRQLAALRDHAGMVFQHFNLFPHRTVVENVTEGPIFVQHRPRDEAREEALALLARVGLADKADAYPSQLSGGQQQRVGIVRALAQHPPLLLFDEPTSALDPELVGDVLRIMRGLAEEGRTMVVVTHELEFARQVAHEVVFVDGGVVVERGAPEAVLRDPQQPRTRQFLDRILHPLA